MKQFILFFLTIGVYFYANGQYSLENLPSPKLQGQDYYVSNPDDILSYSTVSELDAISTNIDSLTKAEYAIVIVNDFEGDDIFDFSFKLFNHWEIGKKESNNGLLLFIALNRREWQFISGYGMESILPDAYLKRIGEQIIVPHFKSEEYDNGVLEVSRILLEVLSSPDAKAELDRMLPEKISIWSFQNAYMQNSLLIFILFVGVYLWIGYIKNRVKGMVKAKTKALHPIVGGCGCMGILMFLGIFIFAFGFNNLEEVYHVRNLPYFVSILGILIIAMQYNKASTQINTSYRDQENISQALQKFRRWTLPIVVISPLAIFDMLSIKGRVNKFRQNLLPPDDSGSWTRLNRDTLANNASKYLDQGQMKEETIGSKFYEIWINKLNNATTLTSWEGKNNFKKCANCGYQTSENLDEIIKNPTYYSTGLKRMYDECRFCNHIVERGQTSIPKKVQSSSSSSSSGGGGGSSSSSGGGSFGGGSSGGGGAGGKW